MAPLDKATVVQVGPGSGQHIPEQPVAVEEIFYNGEVDPTWLIGNVANGGYVFGLALDAATQFQSTRAHRDVLHATAHFLGASERGSFSIRVRNLRTSGSYTNVTAELFQKGQTKIVVHHIFGTNGPHAKDEVRLTLNPPSPWARRHPLTLHPASAKPDTGSKRLAFRNEISMAQDAGIVARNDAKSSNRTNSSTIGGGGLEWGSWVTLNDKDSKITPATLPFLGDIFANSPSLLPQSERNGLGLSWFPTMVMTIEFKNPIPPPSGHHSARTVGVYSVGRFINNPQSRHEINLEIWTAPSDIGEGGAQDKSWRDNQVCIAVATQMAICVPFDVNARKGKL